MGSNVSEVRILSLPPKCRQGNLFAWQHFEGSVEGSFSFALIITLVFANNFKFAIYWPAEQLWLVSHAETKHNSFSLNRLCNRSQLKTKTSVKVDVQ